MEQQVVKIYISETISISSFDNIFFQKISSFQVPQAIGSVYIMNLETIKGFFTFLYPKEIRFNFQDIRRYLSVCLCTFLSLV